MSVPLRFGTDFTDDHGEPLAEPIAALDRAEEIDAEWEATFARENNGAGRKEPIDSDAMVEVQTQRELRNLKAKHAATRLFEEEQAASTDEDRAQPLNWPDFLARDLTVVDWFPGKIMAKGQQIALVGDGKAGKSLFALEWAWRTSAGLPFLGDKAREPMKVLYVDQENSHDDIQSRLMSLGATAEQLVNLDYLSFPAFRPLSTAGGGGDLLRAVKRFEASLVILDTISRMVEGKENDSDPWLDLYRHTLLPLKRYGASSARLDHFGKDKERGSRGSSAKTQDVDHVWELTVEEGNQLKLKRTHTRTGIGEDYFNVQRLGEKDGDRWAAGKTRHVLGTEVDGFAGPAKTGGEVAKAIAAILDKGAIPVTWGRVKTGQWLRSNGHRFADAVISDAIKYRQENPI